MTEYICGVGETYPNLGSLASVVVNDDIINLTDTGVIVETGSVQYNKSVTIRSHPDNTNKPQIKFFGGGGYNGAFESMYTGSGTTFLFQNTKFLSPDTANLDYMFIIYYAASEVIFDSCEFVYQGTGQLGITINVLQGKIQVKNCKFIDIPGDCCGLADYSGQDIIVVNNSFYNFNAIWSYLLGIMHVSGVGGSIYIINNIMHGNGNANTPAISIAGSPSSIIQDYNCIHACSAEYIGLATTAPHNRDSTQTPGVTDPLFKDALSGNLKLNINSPCIDAGAGTAVYSGIPTVDFMDSTRPYVWADKSSVDNGTDMGAYEMNPSYYSANTFDQTSAVPNQQVTSSLDRDWVVHQIQAADTDTYFDATSELSSVVVRYTHEDNRQRKTIVHSGPGLQGETSWPTGARDGTWEKTEVISYDANGAKSTLLRANIGSNEDIVMTDGTMNLNV